MIDILQNWFSGKHAVLIHKAEISGYPKRKNAVLTRRGRPFLLSYVDFTQTFCLEEQGQNQETD